MIAKFTGTLGNKKWGKQTNKDAGKMIFRYNNYTYRVEIGWARFSFLR